MTEVEGLDLVGILSSIDETAYVWNIRAGRLDWESNAAAVLGIGSASQIATSKQYEAMMAVEHARRRMDAIRQSQPCDPERGASYYVQYRFRPDGDRSDRQFYVEDRGRWWPDSHGEPAQARGVIRIVPESYIKEQRMLFSSDVDELTGQLNRSRLTDAISVIIERCQMDGKTAGLLVVAVKNLAVINETFGFDIGDEVIANVAQTIRGKLRGGDILGRYSSNKFGVVIQDCGETALQIAAERILRAIRNRTIKTTAGQISVTASAGGVIIPEFADTVKGSLDAALRALDQSKTRSSDCYKAFEPNANDENSRSRSRAIADDVLTALDERRMRLVLQPMVNARTEEAELYECLLRMERADGQIIAASKFITVAEQLGLSRLIDRRTLELAIDLLRKHRDIRLSVNVSALTCTDQEWLSTLNRLTGGNRDILERMVIEITETVAIQDIDQSINFVDTLKDMGCKVAIDDFGAGYTSFKNLRLLNVDMLKIDGDFVKNVATDTSDQIFVTTMINLAKSLKLQTVAEMVGDEACVQYLREAGVDLLQGFHYGLPIEATELPKETKQKSA